MLRDFKISVYLTSVGLIGYIGSVIFSFFMGSERVCSIFDLIIIKDIWGVTECSATHFWGGRFLFLFIALLGPAILIISLFENSDESRKDQG